VRQQHVVVLREEPDRSICRRLRTRCVAHVEQIAPALVAEHDEL
jgi:hypothetical protein